MPVRSSTTLEWNALQAPSLFLFLARFPALCAFRLARFFAAFFLGSGSALAPRFFASPGTSAEGLLLQILDDQ